jgi:hypothetical protein
MNAKKKYDYGSVDVIKISNKALYVILDSIIEHEKRCDYYSSNLLFDIMILDEKILIGSIGERIKKSKSIIGCFFYKNHLFFVDAKCLNKDLFYETEYKLQYPFTISQTRIDSKTKVMFIDTLDMQNDSYSYWTFIYKNNNFVLYEKSTYCE